MKPFFIFGTFLVLLFSGCKSQQYTPENLPENQLIFGSGGGMTGAVDTYILLNNGQLFHLNSLTSENEELEKLNRKETKTCFKKLKAIQLDSIDFNHPGNRYYFLEEMKGDEKHRVTWGSTDHEVSEACQELYNQLKTVLN